MGRNRTLFGLPTAGDSEGKHIESRLDGESGGLSVMTVRLRTLSFGEQGGMMTSRRAFL